ncbi:MAG: UDP-N-acetylglucosamine 4-epimerase [Saprospiraceae bacterium]|jgi:UDP-N-acetylglucosamine 4-epimerase
MSDWKINTKYHKEELSAHSFLVTGGAGFIGSNIVQYLMDNGAGKVRVLDDFSNGYHENLVHYVNDDRFELIEGSITDIDTCIKACEGIDYVSHQAALGSVPRSIKNPLATHQANATGFLNVITAAKNAGVKQMVYASSSSVYGSNVDSPKLEDGTGEPLSPYATSKKSNELYAKVFKRVYDFNTIGLRYFNIFGPKQSPNGPYAAVIPLYMDALLANKSGKIFGDGMQSRDFTFVENAVQANIKAMFTKSGAVYGEVCNIACGEKTSVVKLYDILKDAAKATAEPQYCPPRTGDIIDSLASISRAEEHLGYNPSVHIKEGLEITLSWFKDNHFNK